VLELTDPTVRKAIVWIRFLPFLLLLVLVVEIATSSANACAYQGAFSGIRALGAD